MAKKRRTRRPQNASRSPQAVRDAQVASRPQAPVRAAAVPQVEETRPVAKTVDFSQEYQYVVGDLKRVGVIAAAMFAILAALAYVI
jgi:hypothetical protein